MWQVAQKALRYVLLLAEQMISRLDEKKVVMTEGKKILRLALRMDKLMVS